MPWTPWPRPSLPPSTAEPFSSELHLNKKPPPDVLRYIPGAVFSQPLAQFRVSGNVREPHMVLDYTKALCYTREKYGM